jgi:hypothetical protein
MSWPFTCRCRSRVHRASRQMRKRRHRVRQSRPRRPSPLAHEVVVWPVSLAGVEPHGRPQVSHKPTARLAHLQERSSTHYTP